MTAPAPGVTAEEEAVPTIETIRFSISAMRAGVDTVVGIFALAVLLRRQQAIVDIEWCEVAPYDPDDPWENHKEYYFWCDSRTPLAQCAPVVAVFRETPRDALALALRDLGFLNSIGQDKDSPRQTLVTHLDELKRTASASFDAFGRTGHWDTADHAEFIANSTTLGEWVDSWILKRLRSNNLVD